MLWTKTQHSPQKTQICGEQEIRTSRIHLVPRRMMQMVSLTAYDFLLVIFVSNCLQFLTDGWGSSQGGGTWQPTTEKTEPGADVNQVAAAAPTAQVAVKHEQPAATMETHADGGETAVWFMERVCVQLKSDERAAVIKEINADKTAIVELEDKSTQAVRVDEVSRVNPKEKDMVLVIGGADVGVEGELVCIDGSDAILKDSNEDFKIVDFVHLAKIAGES